jgi:hypothetical protein
MNDGMNVLFNSDVKWKKLSPCFQSHPHQTFSHLAISLVHQPANTLNYGFFVGMAVAIDNAVQNGAFQNNYYQS